MSILWAYSHKKFPESRLPSHSRLLWFGHLRLGLQHLPDRNHTETHLVSQRRIQESGPGRDSGQLPWDIHCSIRNAGRLFGNQHRIQTSRETLVLVSCQIFEDVWKKYTIT